MCHHSDLRWLSHPSSIEITSWVFSLHLCMPTRIHSAHWSREMFSKHSWIITSVYAPSTIEHMSGFSLLSGLKKKISWSYKAMSGLAFVPLFSIILLQIPSSSLCISHTSLLSCQFFECSLLSVTQNLSKCSSLCLNALPPSICKQHCLLNSYSSFRSILITASSAQRPCLPDTVTHLIWCFPINMNFSLWSQVSIYIYPWLIGAWPPHVKPYAPC